jgi:hypothetical protein
MYSMRNIVAAVVYPRMDAAAGKMQALDGLRGKASCALLREALSSTFSLSCFVVIV